MNNHLSSQQMLAYVDGELSKSEMRRAEDHLHSCWTCLAEMERLKNDITTILDAQNESFSPALPPPPRPWPSFDALLARSLPTQPASLWVRLTAYLNAFVSPARIVVISVAAAALFFCGYAIFRAKPVSAKEVLMRIQLADTKRSAIAKDQVIRERVHIRRTLHGRGRSQLGTVDTWKSPTATYWNVEASDSTAVDLKAQYQAHGIPVGLPLSAASVDSWGKAAGGDPTVSQQGSDLDLSFTGGADGGTGSVERVDVLIQPDTWQIKQMTLDFPDSSFEVTEDDYSVMPTSAMPTELLAYLEPGAAPAIAPHPQPAASLVSANHLPVVNLDEAELNVFTTLHNLKADLGEPVTVNRSSQAVEVGIWQLPPDRQNELRAALAAEPGVQVEFTPPRIPIKNSILAQTESQVSPSSDTPLHIEVQSGDEDQRLFKFFGNADREQDFTNDALATSTAILSHLYALRNLQEQFPASRDQSLPDEEQSELRALVQDHVTAITTNLEALGRQLAPLDANFHVAPCTSSVATTVTNWQGGSLEALDTARVVDHLLRALLTTNEAPAVPDSALPQIDENLCRLRAELQNLSTEVH